MISGYKLYIVIDISGDQQSKTLFKIFRENEKI